MLITIRKQLEAVTMSAVQNVFMFYHRSEDLRKTNMYDDGDFDRRVYAQGSIARMNPHLASCQTLEELASF